MKAFAIALALLANISVQASTSQEEQKPSYIVKFKDGGMKSLEELGSVKKLRVSFGNFALFNPSVEFKADTMNKLMENPSIEYIEPNHVYTLDTMSKGRTYKTRDRLYSKQWGLKNTGANSSGSIFTPGVAGIDINAEEAWKITTGHKDVLIAVIDTGVDHRHPDLKRNLWVNQAEKNGQPGVDDDGNGYIDDVYGYDFANGDGDPMDGHGHGTHCAGVIGAEHNSKGVAGVMRNVKIVSLKFLTDKGRGNLAHALESINYAIKAGVKIMSNSWGGGPRSQALADAIKKAHKAGVIFVAAAGNSSANNDSKPTYPANYKVDNVVSIGAIQGNGRKAMFSNYGKNTVHAFAPGKNIMSTVTNGKYKNMSGTSMATPFAAGVLGLLLASEPNISHTDAIKRMLNTSIKPARLARYSKHGRIDAHRMLTNQRD